MLHIRRLLLLRRLCNAAVASTSSTSTSTRASSTSADKKTHFGFQEVPEQEKEERVYSVFQNVAQKYDVMNDAMSFGVHRAWKDVFVGMAPLRRAESVIDVAGGTGDIAFRLASAAARIGRRPSITVCDISRAMLEVGRQRAVKGGGNIDWREGNAESLPFDDASFDLYTIAFGIRNCTHVDRVLKEAYRVLKPNKRSMFMCLEFSAVANPLLSRLYDAYSFNVIPVLGQLIASDWHSYQYLVESIRQFPAQEEFAEMIRAAGFERVTYRNVSAGIAAVHCGMKR